ncbi:hypothetical protein ALC60_00902 [Trachymyrmex zeteki]|uniref:Uncharacterized protein n=1 Tax=Mycetomoellerius zeteki TaxID=64791 RepID=A0A151XIG4_9HYME|nr:hypothetical protein ALC60_00902 [Trachymyrmex zeteki]
MRLLSDVERLMAARMAVRSEARGSGEATTKVRSSVAPLWKSSQFLEKPTQVLDCDQSTLE